RLETRFARTQSVWDDALLAAVRRPFTFLIWILGFSLAAQIVALEMDSDLAGLINAAREVLVISMLAWFLISFISQVEERVMSPKYGREPVDRTTVLAVGKLLRSAVVITAGLMIMQTLGFSVSGVLAAGGIGGIAIGFAAKDMLANFFGAMVIFLDRPFAVGDWIRSPDKQIEGTVENIGWRMTRIRTFDKRPLYVPNAIFTQISVENPSRMLNRRIYETIGLRYGDAAVLAPIVADVKAMLAEHPEIDQSQTQIINFDAFGPSSLNFFIYVFTKTTDWVKYHGIKQDVLLKVLEIIHRHGADVAFPTTTLDLPPDSIQALAGQLQGDRKQDEAREQRNPEKTV
ncbi:MAG TPA: mechanosensitive ion channel family protein, partial [Spongiibacteraceae bacterium]|nr:mechanosensitive ion channel family protein [Spongiibacteraceae bacterium]